MYGVKEKKPRRIRRKGAERISVLTLKFQSRAKFLTARARWEVDQTKKYPASPLGFAGRPNRASKPNAVIHMQALIAGLYRYLIALLTFASSLHC